MTDRRVGRAIVQCIALLAAVNVVVNRVVGGFAVVVVNVAASVVLVALARRAGATRVALGIDPGAVARGWRVARWFALATVVTFAVGLALPATREWFEDERARDLGAWSLAYHVLVGVPFGTVLLEEVAFRGVLPALLASTRSRFQGVIVASVLFGLWHVLPAWNIHQTNPVVRDLLHGAAGRVVGVGFGVASTTLVGLAWCWLRYRTGSLWTTAMVHAASNGLAYLFAYLAWSLR